MRILYCTNQLSVHGGIERILSQKINHLLEEGHDIHLITFEQKNDPDVYPLNSRVSRIDLQIKYDNKRSYFHPKNLISILKHYSRLKNKIKKIQPELIISVSYTPDQFFLPFMETTIPKVKELHSSGVVVGFLGKKKRHSLKRRLTDIFKKYDAVVLLNKDEIPYFEGCNSIVIPNFIDIQTSANVLHCKEKTIIAAGRIAPVKQFQELIYIWNLVHPHFPDWRFKLFGDGEQYLLTELQNLISSLGLSSSFLMYSSIDNLQEEMGKASIYAMTSQTECFPMVLLEAKSCGLPIVSYDCPFGPRNIIRNGMDGYLISQNDRISFARKLSQLMNNTTLRTTIAASTIKNVDVFSKEEIMKQWNKLFCKIV